MHGPARHRIGRVRLAGGRQHVPQQPHGNAGAGVRLGGAQVGSKQYGIDNDIYGNQYGATKVMVCPQRTICGNTLASNGSYSANGSYHFRLEVDVPSHKYYAFVMPRGDAERTLGVDFSFRSEQSSVTGLDNWAVFVNSALGSTSVCNPTLTRHCAYAVDGAAHTFIEAERFSAKGGDFTLLSSSGRSGGQYMSLPQGSGDNDAADYLKFALDVTTGGTLSLPSGRHTLWVRGQEDGSSLDKIVFTKSSSYTPSGLGGAVASCK